MSGRHIAIAIALVVVAVVVQSTLLAESRLQLFGSAPALVVLVLIAVVRYLDPEPAVLLGFTAGLLVDLVGGQPVGLWAMVMTVVAYVTLRVRDRAADGPLVIGVGVLVLTLMAGGLFVILGTLFGLKPLSDPAVFRRLILPAIYNVVLAIGVVPGVTKLLEQRRPRRGWA
ncbi:MAG: rod shape-determining protein MreD [Acidimicrobiia bacterium]|nr:rod shape-determining protein MreD [Acidimicrobiia bacterium]